MTPTKPQVYKTLLDVYKEGGWGMHFLFLGSLCAAGLTIESLFKLRLGRTAPQRLQGNLRAQIAQGQFQEALSACRQTPCFLSRALETALEELGHSREAAYFRIQSHADTCAAQLTRRLPWFLYLTAFSLLIGFAGTIWGMIRAFQTLGLGGLFDPSLVAAALGEVLLISLAGCMVAIVHLTLYFAFRSRAQNVISQTRHRIAQLTGRIPYEKHIGQPT